MMLTVDEYMAFRRLISSERESEESTLSEEVRSEPKKRRKSAYGRKYSAAFRRIAPTYKNKNGTWRKGGFKAAVKAAHKAVKK